MELSIGSEEPHYEGREQCMEALRRVQRDPEYRALVADSQRTNQDSHREVRSLLRAMAGAERRTSNLYGHR